MSLYNIIRKILQRLTIAVCLVSTTSFISTDAPLAIPASASTSNLEFVQDMRTQQSPSIGDLWDEAEDGATIESVRVELGMAMAILSGLSASDLASEEYVESVEAIARAFDFESDSYLRSKAGLIAADLQAARLRFTESTESFNQWLSLAQLTSSDTKLSIPERFVSDRSIADEEVEDFDIRVTAHEWLG